MESMAELQAKQDADFAGRPMCGCLSFGHGCMRSE